MNKLLRIFFILTISLASSVSMAAKFDIMGGFFSLSAKTGENEGELANLGSYKVNYLMPIHPQLEFGLGYSVAMSSVIGGDLAFGFDLGLYYFPITNSGAYRTVSGDTKVFFQELWRPFVFGSFNQRQFQSVQSNYAGYSLGAGVERAFTAQVNFKTEARVTILTGARDGEATQIDVLAGISLPF